MLKLTRGFEFRHKVKSFSSKLIIINTFNKYVVSTIQGMIGEYYLVATAEETSKWEAGKYSYQIINESGTVEEGDFTVLQNYDLADTSNYQSHWKNVLEAVEATIAGRATNAQLNVHVGDKSLQYCSLNELLNLREFVNGKVAEENKAEGKKSFNQNDQHTIKYRWEM